MVKIVVGFKEYVVDTAFDGDIIEVYDNGQRIAQAERDGQAQTLYYDFYNEEEGRLTDGPYNDFLYAAPVEDVAQFLINNYPGTNQC